MQLGGKKHVVWFPFRYAIKCITRKTATANINVRPNAQSNGHCIFTIHYSYPSLRIADNYSLERTPAVNNVQVKQTTQTMSECIFAWSCCIINLCSTMKHSSAIADQIKG